MKDRTVCVILQNLHEAPIDEGSDNLRHFENRIWSKSDTAPTNEGSAGLRHSEKIWWSACKWFFRSMMCERFIKNAFESLQNLNFCFFIKFDVPLRNKKLGLYYLQEKNVTFQILKTWRVKVTHESIFASKYDF